MESGSEQASRPSFEAHCASKHRACRTFAAGGKLEMVLAVTLRGRPAIVSCCQQVHAVNRLRFSVLLADIVR